MNRHALQVLQFSEALDVVAGYASGPLGAAAVRALEPSYVLSVVNTELQRVEQMLLFLQRAESWAAPALPDLRAQLRKLLVEGSVWDPAPLRDLATVLESSRSTRSAIQKQR